MQHRPPRSRLFAIAAAGVAALLTVGLAGCGGGGDDDSSSASGGGGPVTLRIGDQSKTLELPLTLSGENKGTSYSLNFNNFADGPHMNAAFSASKIDFGFMGDTPVLFANAADAGVVAVAIAESPTNSQTIYAREGSGIQTPADLKGKRVAFTEGTSLHGYLLRQLDFAGLTQDDITPVNVPATSLVSTFVSGEVDAVVWVNQYSGAITAQDKSAYEIKVTPLPQYSVLLAASSALDDPAKRAAVTDFILRVARASTWPKANPDTWIQKYYVELLKQDPVTSRKYFDSLPATQYQPITEAFLESQQAQADLLVGVDKLPKTFDVDNEIDTAFNTELSQKFAAAGLTK
ncbi:ABC transporter substrate-binding protein [Frankia sp. CNm7]|uniref:ABC transporter substrate-binding protein n=1 Tax=Frankia nepalensis TaxID=1836974 RepID=A0A937RM86_9ACTN|nr:ABC transporter substrate-binding protein [Frankia nepalensis]MBL7501183.1 ABC transporter substrate-binding protein [Frankia nepalensis]MBL7515735.1 ABC transporter substrate-binding protein [Frankia nepalensis]MBL7519712.1 ABC transporter substrate-binding protein [Frankia nepalensis]MBL7631399.1 ABC transporter substrate-binding protein [Frankia nepalensis]